MVLEAEVKQRRESKRKQWSVGQRAGCGCAIVRNCKRLPAQTGLVKCTIGALRQSRRWTEDHRVPLHCVHQRMFYERADVKFSPSASFGMFCYTIPRDGRLAMSDRSVPAYAAVYIYLSFLDSGRSLSPSSPSPSPFFSSSFFLSSATLRSGSTTSPSSLTRVVSEP